MSSDRQIEANRRNAKLSTGPRTADGKARVALNALKHGLTGKQVVLPNENPEDYDTFRADLLDAMDPHGALEGMLAESIVIAEWRLRRAPLMEAALYRRGHQASIIANQKRELRRYRSTETSRLIERGLEFERTQVTDVKAHADALARLKESRSKLDDPSLQMTVMFETHAATLTNLWRHEAALSRSRSRTMHDLRWIQAMRAGEPVAAPTVVDGDAKADERVAAPAVVGGDARADERVAAPVVVDGDAKAGERVAAPAVVDGDVSGNVRPEEILQNKPISLEDRILVRLRELKYLGSIAREL